MQGHKTKRSVHSRTDTSWSTSSHIHFSLKTQMIGGRESISRHTITDMVIQQHRFMGTNDTNARSLLKRRRSRRDLSLVLSLDRLGRLLLETLPNYTADSALATIAADRYAQITEHLDDKTTQGVSGEELAEHFRNELSLIEEVLGAFIMSLNADVPAVVVFEVHFLRGLMQEELRRNQLAVLSYTKALWIASAATSEVPKLQLILTMHHLGKVYGATGNYDMAVDLLDKVLVEYENLQLPSQHSCLVDAKAFLQNLEDQHVRRLPCKHRPSHSMQNIHRLPFIMEEGDEAVECSSV